MFCVEIGKFLKKLCLIYKLVGNSKSNVFLYFSVLKISSDEGKFAGNLLNRIAEVLTSETVINSSHDFDFEPAETSIMQSCTAVSKSENEVTSYSCMKIPVN